VLQKRFLKFNFLSALIANRSVCNGIIVGLNTRKKDFGGLRHTLMNLCEEDEIEEVIDALFV